MHTNQVWPRWRNALSLAILTLSCVSPAWSDVHLPSLSAEGGEKACYCSCDNKPGTAMCAEACDPAKYKGHSSARICESKQEKARIMAPPASHTTSKKNNRVQAASL